MKRGAPTWAPASRTHSSNETTWLDDVKKHITVLSESLPANLFRNRTRSLLNLLTVESPARLETASRRIKFVVCRVRFARVSCPRLRFGCEIKFTRQLCVLCALAMCGVSSPAACPVVYR